jgi:hypothetical protein
MKTKITLLSLIVGLELSAQTITYANFSTALTSTLNAVLANTTSFNISLTTTTGNGVTWNASGLTQQTGTPTLHFIYGSPAATPYASTFPTANFAHYDPALVSVLNYDYFVINADSMSKVGEYTSSSGAHEVYQNADKHLIFPFSFGQSFTDTYAKTNYSNATTVSSNQTGSRTVSFNGFGTLILPQGTFNNVALVSEMRTNSLGPNSTEFTWFDISNGKQLMYYSENNGNVTAAYTTDISTGINEIIANNISTVYPNPFANTTTININANITLKNASVSIVDMLGKQVKSMRVDKNEIQLNRDDLQKGIYFYQVLSNEKIISTGKLIIE